MDDFVDPEAGEPACCPWDEYAIRDQGRVVARAGKPKENPYQEGTDNYWSWSFGYDSVKRNEELRKKKNEKSKGN